MIREKKPRTIVQDGEARRNDDDVNLDSFGVEAPPRDVFALFAEKGYPPEAVNEAIRERYVQYLERMERKK